MIVKTEGIVLRSRPFSKTSRMVTWLTPDYGRVTTVIKGACRPKSFFLGQTDLGYRCELLFYRKEHNGVHIAREVYPFDYREGLRGNWRASVAADYICWLISQVTEPMLESAELYALLNRTLDEISALTDCEELEDKLTSFEFLLLDALGISPSFNFCQDCTFGPEKRKSCRFMLSSGRIGCIHALSIHREQQDSVALTPSLVEALASTQAKARAQAQFASLRVCEFASSSAGTAEESTVSELASWRVGELASSSAGAAEESTVSELASWRVSELASSSAGAAKKPAVSELASSSAEPTNSQTRKLANSQTNKRLLIGVRRFLGLFICQHLDVPMYPRSTAYAWLDWERYDKSFTLSPDQDNTGNMRV